MNRAATHLLDRIRRREARVGVVGLGYVGLPLAAELARAAGDHGDATAEDAREAVA